MTVPEIVQNLLTSKPSKPVASHKYKQETERPFIHQEPHKEQPLPYYGLHTSEDFFCHSGKPQILLPLL